MLIIVNRKLNDVLTTRIIKFFLEQSKKDPENYMKFYEDYGLFFREGIVTTHDQDLRVRMGTRVIPKHPQNGI